MPKIYPDDIIKTVEEYYQIPANELRLRKREPKYIRPVHIIWYLCCKYTTWHCRDLARMMNRKSHCDVVHAKKSVKNQMDTSKDYKREVDDIERRLLDRTNVRDFLYYMVMKQSS